MAFVGRNKVALVVPERHKCSCPSAQRVMASVPNGATEVPAP